MKFGELNKSTILNRFGFQTLQRNTTHLAVITRKTNIKLGILKGGKVEKCLLEQKQQAEYPTFQQYNDKFQPKFVPRFAKNFIISDS